MPLWGAGPGPPTLNCREGAAPWAAGAGLGAVLLLTAASAGIPRSTTQAKIIRQPSTRDPHSVASDVASQPLHLAHRRTALIVGTLATELTREQNTAYAAGLRNALFVPLERGVSITGYKGQPVVIAKGIRASPVTAALRDYDYPSDWPYRAKDFRRLDESADGGFYTAPRFEMHIDDDAVGALRSVYEALFQQATPGEYAVLDICSSWVSHYPSNLKARRVAVAGMNAAELQRNEQATELSLGDLNVDPSLPYSDSSFDFVTNAVSVDYLVRPREVVSEVHRVLRPGGVAVFSFSNRCFPSKVILMWGLRMEDGVGHCRIVANYFWFSPIEGWRDISCVDVSPNPGRTDPMWVVTAVKA